MKNTKIIEAVMNEILRDEIRYGILNDKLQEFKSYLLEITEIDLNAQEDREDLQFDNGIALCTTFAAMCIDDIIRTRQFIRGIYKAIIQVKRKKEKPVTIFYAGTGPFATLILPILTKFSCDEIQLILMDVNQKTLNYLDRIIKTLSIGNYVQDIVCADASVYKFDKNWKIDILVSETMQYGLVREQQVPIMINLVNQLPLSSIIIPNNIKLDLALMNNNAELILNNRHHLKYQKLQTLLNFNTEFIHSIDDQQKKRISMCEKVDIPVNAKSFDKAVVLTSIQVFEEEWIQVDESGLTIPKILFPLSGLNGKRKLSVSYVIKREPNFDYQLS